MMTEPADAIWGFIKHNWVQLGIFAGAIFGILINSQSRKDKHLIDKATKFNLDLDNFNDTFDLSQKLLKSLRQQLDSTQLLLNNTQKLLDKANKAYALLELELLKVREENEGHLKKIKCLSLENKELQLKINSCEFDCKFKKPIKTQKDDTDN